MMKRLNKCVAFGLLAVSLAACNDENPWAFSQDEGGIQLRLTTSGNVISTKPATRASESIDVPDAAQFGLTLTKADGTPAGIWESVGDFNTEETFEVGDYTIKAHYGDKTQEGYDAPYFEGSTDVSVRPGECAQASIEASLANAMVTVTYTDGFKAYFSSCTTSVHSEGNSTVQLDPAREGDPIYVNPSDKVKLTLDFVKQNGMAARLEPAQFEAKACHHYYIELNVDAATSGLEVKFFDDIDETHDVAIDISDQVLSQPTPEVSTAGFTAGEDVPVLELTPLTLQPRFNIFAGAGISEVTLKIESATLNPAVLGNEFEIVGLNDMGKSEFTALGLKCVGLWKNLAQMAYVDLTGIAEKLGVGTHTFTLTVKDKLTRVSDPVSITMDVTPVTLEFVGAELSSYGDDTAIIYVDYNGVDLANNVKITAVGGTGITEDCRILSVAPYTAPASRTRRYTPTRAASDFPAVRYVVTISIPTVTENNRVPLNLYYKDTLREEDAEVTLKEYSAEVSPYATKAYVKLSAAASQLASVVNNMTVQANGAAATILSRDAANGYLVVGGLTPDTEYTLTFTSGNGEVQQAVIVTEQSLAVPNGDFEQLAQKYNVSDLNQGGTYQRTLIASGSAASLQNHQHYTVSEPTGWATNNAKSMSGSPENSWFKIFSVYNTSLSFTSEVACNTGGTIGSGEKSTPDRYNSSSLGTQSGSNAMVLRNVAWDTAGSVPSHKKWSAATASSYYNPNTPSLSAVSAGRLFLGSYNYSGGSETINQGVGFASRPTALKGYYKYACDSQDTGECGTVAVSVIGTDGSVIGSGSASLTAAGSFTEFTATITYTKPMVKAQSLRIMFCSSNRAESAIKTTKTAALFLQEAAGAMLTVDNLTFTY